MRPLSDRLRVAQQAETSEPYVEAVLRDQWGNAQRLRWSRFYDSMTEPDGPIAAVIAGDGSLIRARTAGGMLHVSRVPAPGADSHYGIWTTLNAVAVGSGVALVLYQGQPALFYVHTDGDTLRWRRSIDDGASWDGFQNITNDGAAAKRHIAAAAQGNGGSDLLLLWSEGDGVVYRSRYNGLSWGARTAWNNSLSAVTGLAVRWYAGDFGVLVAGRGALPEENPGVWACRYGDGGTATPNAWGALRTVASATAGSGWSFEGPSLDVSQLRWRAFFVERYEHTIAYRRVQAASMDGLASMNVDAWQEPVAFDYEAPFSYGTAFAAAGTVGWLVTPRGIWRGEAWAGLDVSEHVVEASVRTDENGSVVRLALDNEGDRFAQAGEGALRLLQPGVRLDLNPGYRTGAEPPAADREVSSVPLGYWVESLAFETGPRPLLILTARDGDWLMQRWRARRQHIADGRIVASALGRLLSSMGLAGPVELSAEHPSPEFNALQILFTIHVGESGATAVQRLMDKVSDKWTWRGGTLVVRNPWDATAPSYAFGEGAHAIVRGRYERRARRVNWSRVQGTGVFAESFDFGAMADAGEATATTLDAGLNGDFATLARANAVLRGDEVASMVDELEVFGVHCGIELWDVVSVTDPGAGLVEAPRRVSGYAWRYQGGRYSMTLSLGRV